MTVSVLSATMITSVKPKTFLLDFDEPSWNMLDVLLTAEHTAEKLNTCVDDIKQLTPTMWEVTTRNALN